MLSGLGAERAEEEKECFFTFPTKKRKSLDIPAVAVYNI